MSENKSEIIECLHYAQFTFFVDNNGNTIINSRLDAEKNSNILVRLNKNIFDTDLIGNISLFTI
jgi:hypothetical protein